MEKALIRQLKRERDVLNELIVILKNKESLSRTDLDFYDVTTRRIERHLRTIGRGISSQVSKIADHPHEKKNGGSK